MNPYKLIERIKHDKTITDDEWLQIRQEIIEFLDSDSPDEEKTLFAPLGYFEMVDIICDGIERKRGIKNG